MNTPATPERPSAPSPLVSSDRVQGTEVYGPNGDHIGEIDTLIIDKVSGRVVYAMMKFGGFLGVGKHYYPVPWPALHYDVDRGGFRTQITEEQVRKAPAYNADGTVDRYDPEMHRRLHDHYAVRGWWDGSEVIAPDTADPRTHDRR